MKVPTWAVKFVGKIYINEKFPWIVYDIEQNEVKGSEIRQILNVIKPGDIILRRYNNYLSSKFIPGTYTHACIYMGGDLITHAIGEGVCHEDVIDFCRCDCIAVVRFKNLTSKILESALLKANNMVKDDIQYDYSFSDDNGKVYCTELVNLCFDNAFINDFSEVAGNNMITPDHIMDSKQVELVIEIKH